MKMKRCDHGNGWTKLQGATWINCTDVTICKGSQTQKNTVEKPKQNESAIKDASSGSILVTIRRAKKSRISMYMDEKGIEGRRRDSNSGG